MPEGQDPSAGTDPNATGTGANPGGSPNTTPPAAGAGAGAGTATNSGAGQDPDKEKNESELRRARDDAAKFRVELQATRDELKKMKDAQLSDTEKQANRVKELEVEAAKLKTDMFLKDVQVALAVAGAKKPELVAKLIPSDAPDITKAVEGLKKDMPELFGIVTPPKPGGVDGGAGKGNGEDLTGMNAIIRRMAGR